MSTDRVLTGSMKKAAKKATSFQYNTANYVVLDMNVRRDVETGRLMSKPNKKSNV